MRPLLFLTTLCTSTLAQQKQSDFYTIDSIPCLRARSWKSAPSL